jgi:diguanylate cyclase (GGDEF)-like protein
VRHFGPRSLVECITKHPWQSLWDGAVLTSFLTVAVLIALHYDIFTFVAALADPQHDITLAEAALLAAILAICVYIFVARRINEERCDEANQLLREREMRELRELAMQDPLTHLPNRRAILTALDAAAADCDPRCTKHALFVLDLNGFKRVNDLHGHSVGDHVLQVVVDRLRRVARPNDLLARLGGDEFAVLSYNVDRAGALNIGTRFTDALKDAISVDGLTHEVGVAIGGALFPDDGATCEAILRRADLAMYRAKKHDGSAVALFDPAADTLKLVHGAVGA